MAKAPSPTSVRPQHASSLTALARFLAPGERVFLPGFTAEPHGLADALFSPTVPPLRVTATYVPGVNVVPVDRFQPGTTYTSMFAPPPLAGQQSRGVFQHLPLSYSAFARHLHDHLEFDSCIVHVAPPDANGQCSLGPAVEFTPIAVRKSKRILAVINHQLPRLPHTAALPLASFAAVTEIDAPLREYAVGAPSPEADAIATRVAEFIHDGATLQIGLGKVPDALMRRLTNRRRLKLFSGMLSDGARALAVAGSLDTGFQHICCLHLGTTDYYDWLTDRAEFSVRGCEHTHAAASLAAQSGQVAVNSALSVDLFGQANSEMLGGHMVSGCGGAPDFAAGAQLSPGGVSIIALPSTGGRDATTRIVSRIDGLVTLPRTAIDIVITEHGVADLRGLSVMERAERLVAVAAPQHRSALAEEWRDATRYF